MLPVDTQAKAAVQPWVSDWAPRNVQLSQRALARAFLWILLGASALLALAFVGSRAPSRSVLRESAPHALPRIDGDGRSCVDDRFFARLLNMIFNETSAPTQALATLLPLYPRNLSMLTPCSDEARAAAALPTGCGGGLLTLLRAYGAWHAQKLAFLRAARGNVTFARELQAAAGDSDPPMSLAVYGPLGGGLGDRLPSIVALFAFALRYRRVFLLDWPPAYGLLFSPWLDWRIDVAEVPLLASALAIKRLEVRWGGGDGHGVWDTVEPDAVSPPGPPISPYMVTNRGIWSYTTVAAHRAFFNELTGGSPACLHQAILRPSPALLSDAAITAVQDRFASERSSGRRVLGLHFRAGDAAMGLQRVESSGGSLVANEIPPLPSDVANKLAAALARAAPHLDSIGAQSSTANASSASALFFLTDFMPTRPIMRAKYPSVIFSDVVPKHIGVDAPGGAAKDSAAATDRLHTSLVDWWLLSQVDAQLGELGTGFGRAALLASKTGVFYSAEGCSPCCDAREIYCHPGLGDHFLTLRMNSGVL